MSIKNSNYVLLASEPGYPDYRDNYEENFHDVFDINQMENFFYKFPYSMIGVKTLTLTDIMVYSVIVSCCNNNNSICWITNEAISKKINISIETVKRSIRKLKNLKIIETSYSDKRENTYRRYTKILINFYKSDENKNLGFFKIYFRIFNYKVLSLNAIIIYSYLASLQSIKNIDVAQKGYVKTHIASIQDKFKLSYNTTKSILRELINVNLIYFIKHKTQIQKVYIKPRIDFGSPQKEEIRWLEYYKEHSKLPFNFSYEEDEWEQAELKESIAKEKKRILNNINSRYHNPYDTIDDFDEVCPEF